VTETAGLYIHVPFCRGKCDYCSFYSEPVLPGDSVLKEYSRRACEEVLFSASLWGKRTIDTVYFGGGTPSLFGGDVVSEILSCTGVCHSLLPGSEITLEMNPHDVTAHNIESFVAAGVNRISLGVQTLNEIHHRTIGRTGRCCTVRDLETFFSVDGYARCIDIITGIPGQKEKELLNDLETVTSFRPEHISLYLLSVEEGTKLHKRFVPGDEFDKEQEMLWDFSIEFLKSKGYIHYEVSNFCLPGFSSRHNMKYWQYDPYIGIGPGAHSFMNNRRYHLSPSVNEYLIGDRFEYIFDERKEYDELIEFVMTGIRCMDGFSPADFTKKTGGNFPGSVTDRLNENVRRGYLASRSGRYSVTDKGLKILNRLTFSILEDIL